MARRWTIGAGGPNETEMAEIASLLEGGEVVILPTDTIYGLHGLALDEKSVARIFEIKGRSGDKALPVLFESLAQMRKAGVLLAGLEARLGEIWPAPLTAILRLERPIAATTGSSTIAARIPALGWLRELLKATGPLASTSANLSGEGFLQDPSALPAEIEKKVGGVVDAGPLGGKASTLVDFTADPPRVIRTGDFFFRQNLWKKSRKTL